MSAPLQLCVTRVSKAFPGVQALAGVDFEVAAGEIHALIGENGAGKSTLVKILGGAFAPDSGELRLGGEPLPVGDPLAVRAAGVGIIYQEFTLVPELSVADNVFLGREAARWGWLGRRRMIDETRAILERLGVGVDPRERVGGLSVGTCQLVEIARALASGSRLLILDEPSATLTPAEIERMFAALRQLRAEGLGIVYISHRLEEIEDLCDRVTVLRDGKWVATARVQATTREQWIQWMVGRAVDPDADRDLEPSGAPSATPRCVVSELSSPPHFRRVSFELPAGRIVGLAGLVGAGRTAVGLCLGGALPAAAGEVRLEGRPVRFRQPAEALRAGVGYLTEDRKGRGIFPDLAVSENVTIGTLGDYARAGVIDEGRRRDAARAACARFDVRSATLDKRIAELSGGNQQKALLARLLLHPLSVVILDEPTRGIDVGARAEIYRLVRALAATGVAVLFISSDLPELLTISDRIVVMREGVTTGELDRADATQERIMQLATTEDAA
ncbi:MAG: sugar ABC transporter ATP-binding protein [Planctomycetota bacterium]